jgi:hypothetical protein
MSSMAGGVDSLRRPPWRRLPGDCSVRRPDDGASGLGKERRDYRMKRRRPAVAGWVRLVLLGGGRAERLRRRSRDRARRPRRLQLLREG